ncbi:MAG: cytochrome d ubiquinol oxidase subunit II [Muribaculaceae bacterium]
MFTLEFLQQYWWFLISVLGAILVFLLFIQGGQSLLFEARNEMERTLMVNALGRKWELSFTTLVVFGGAFFASFPLFYSTSFGGAYWLWVLILITFVLQAVSYEFRSKKGNIFGTRVFDIFLSIGGAWACILLGAAVSTFFFGAEFTISKQNLLNGAAPVISTWAPTHGFEAFTHYENLLLGIAVILLARTIAAMFFIKTIDGGLPFRERCKFMVMRYGIAFAVFFVAYALCLMLTDGYQWAADGSITVVANKYFLNLIEMWWVAIVLVAGVVMVLYAIIRTAFTPDYDNGIWPCGIGTVLVVLSLFWIAGYNNTAFYPSLLDAQSSLTIANSSSSEFTLTAMSIVSLLVPFVAAYIIYAWWALTRKPVTPEEMSGNDHKY